MSIIDILLQNEIPKAQVKEYKIKRLSKLFNTDVKMTLKGLDYNTVMGIKKINKEDSCIHIILAGDSDGVFKNKELMSKYNAVTPAELIKKVLLPGEIEDICAAIERLSGYRENTIEEIKKK